MSAKVSRFPRIFGGAPMEQTLAVPHDGLGRGGHQSLSGGPVSGPPCQFEDEPKPSLTTRIRDYLTKVDNANALDASIHRQAVQLAEERAVCAAIRRELAAELGITAEDFRP